MRSIATHPIFYTTVLFTLTVVLLSSYIQTINAVNSNTNNNDEVSNTIVTLSQNHKTNAEVEAARAEAERIQQLADASTGTVAYGKEAAPPVSCNEIMAKAVVVASEEKEKAFLERDTALAEVMRATERANLLSEQIEIALEDAKNATIEYEAVKLMTDRLVEEVKKTSKEALDKKEEEHLVAIQRVKDEMDDMKQDMENQMKDVQALAETQMEELKTETTKKIETTIEDANFLIAQMQDEVKTVKAQAQKEVETAKSQAETKIQSMTLEFQERENQANQITSTNIQNIQDEATQEINEMKKKVDQVNEQMEALEKSTKDDIEKIKREKDEKIHMAYIESQERERKTMQRAHNIQKDSEDKMEQLRKDVNKEIKDTYKAAEKEYEKVKKEAADELKKFITESNKRLDEKEKQIVELNDEAFKTQKELKDTIKSLNEEIERMEDASSNLDTRLSSISDELEYWKEVGMNPSYVNTTLIVQDTTTYLNRTATELKQKASESFAKSKAKVEEVSKPHVEKVTIIANEFYDEKMKEFVDTSILPFYNEHIVPLQEKFIQTYEDSLIPQFVQLYQQLKNIQEKIQSNTCDGYQNGAKIIRESLEEKEMDAILKFFHAFLQRVEGNPLSYVLIHFKALVLALAYFLRYILLSLVWNILTLPFRIAWFFCPLRLIFGGKKSKNSKKGMKRMSKDRQKNGYTGVVKEKKE